MNDSWPSVPFFRIPCSNMNRQNAAPVNRSAARSTETRIDDARRSSQTAGDRLRCNQFDQPSPLPPQPVKVNNATCLTP